MSHVPYARHEATLDGRFKLDSSILSLPPFIRASIGLEQVSHKQSLGENLGEGDSAYFADGPAETGPTPSRNTSVRCVWILKVSASFATWIQRSTKIVPAMRDTHSRSAEKVQMPRRRALMNKLGTMGNLQAFYKSQHPIVKLMQGTNPPLRHNRRQQTIRQQTIRQRPCSSAPLRRQIDSLGPTNSKKDSLRFSFRSCSFRSLQCNSRRSDHAC